MAVVVENLPADADTRLRKQLRDLLSHGYRVSVITQAGELLRRYFSPELERWERFDAQLITVASPARKSTPGWPSTSRASGSAQRRR